MKIANQKRKQRDINKLILDKFYVYRNQDHKTIIVDFKGPINTPYENGFWKVRVYFPDEYPYKSPSIGFKNKIFHPNIDYSYYIFTRSGTVCLDVINQTWTPIYDLTNIFLPQLLTYPNPNSPLNHEAAAYYISNMELYEQKIKKYIEIHASGKKFMQLENQEKEKQEERMNVKNQDESSQISNESGISQEQLNQEVLFNY